MSKYFSELKKYPVNYLYLTNNPNITWDIIQSNPDCDWNLRLLPLNSNITWDIIRSNLDKNWDWGIVSSMDDLPLDFIQANLDKNWDWSYLSLHPNMTLEFVKNNLDKPWVLEKMDCITWEFIQENLNIQWDWLELCKNPKFIDKIIESHDIRTLNANHILYDIHEMPIENLIKLVNNGFILDGDYLEGITCQMYPITWDFIEQHMSSIQLPWVVWYWTKLSSHKNITWDIIVSNPDKPWYWNSISHNPNITLKIIQENLDKEWNWDFLLSWNNNFLSELIEMCVDKELVLNFNNIPQFIRDLPEFDNFMMYISSNPNITLEIVQKNPDKQWDWKQLSTNPNVTWKFVINNLDKDWNWNLLSRNDIYYSQYFCSDEYRKKQLKKFWEASKEEFIALTWHPDRVNRGWCLDEDDKKERLAFYGI